MEKNWSVEVIASWMDDRRVCDVAKDQAFNIALLWIANAGKGESVTVIVCQDGKRVSVLSVDNA